MRLGFWLKGWDKKFPNGPGDVANNLDCVRIWKKERRQRPVLDWNPPPTNKLKWNVDGSAKGKPGEAGIGGVLRDEYGNILGMFSAYVGIRDSNEAEFMAIVFALEMSLQKVCVMEKELIVESDSRNTLSWANSIETCPWKLIFYGNKLKNLLVILKDVSFVHKYRESNCFVDSLAKKSAQREECGSLGHNGCH